MSSKYKQNNIISTNRLTVNMIRKTVIVTLVVLSLIVSLRLVVYIAQVSMDKTRSPLFSTRLLGAQEAEVEQEYFPMQPEDFGEVMSNWFYVELQGDADPEKLAKELGFEYAGTPFGFHTFSVNVAQVMQCTPTPFPKHPQVLTVHQVSMKEVEENLALEV
jgi:hypothetical protein